MVRSVRWFGAALIAAALVSSADAQTTPAPDAQTRTQTQSQTPTLHARAKHHARKHHVAAQEPEGRQITVHKRASIAPMTPSSLTLGTQAPVGTGTNYVTSTFDQPSPIEGTFSGFRGRERLNSQWGVPGTPLFQF